MEPLETLKPKKKPAKAEAPPEKAETGLLKRNTPDGEHKYWLYVHEDYDPNISYGLVVWLHPPGKNKEADFESITDLWGDYCKENQLILVCPTFARTRPAGCPAKRNSWWPPSGDTIEKYTVDRQRDRRPSDWASAVKWRRYLGLNNRDLFRGSLVTVGAVLTQAKDNNPAQPLSFYLARGQLGSAHQEHCGQPHPKLAAAQIPGGLPRKSETVAATQYFEEIHVQEVVRWIDSLDRQ